MADIQVLSSDTIDKIAAGEVVERPRNVVKELVENSIDSGATNISVEIRGGGVELIRVTDNGVGIVESQAQDAFIRHATSKLRSINDLDVLTSLGFRGEALSSIAGVSKTEMITKTKDSLLATHVVIEGGILKENSSIGAPDGTTMLVRQLFYNTPARRKFLKSEATEASYIQDIMEKFAVSHPEIGFRFQNGKQQKIVTAGTGKLSDVIYRIFGKEAYEACLPVEYSDDRISIKGYVSKPEFSSSGRSQEIYFVNGRYVKNDVITNGIEEVYRNYLMQHKFPFCVLIIQVNPKNLDVNVHPQKMEVRFSDNEFVRECVIQSVSDALRNKELIPRIHDSQEDKVFPNDKSDEYMLQSDTRTTKAVHEVENYVVQSMNEMKETAICDMNSIEKSEHSIDRKEDFFFQVEKPPSRNSYQSAPEPFEIRRMDQVKQEMTPVYLQTDLFEEQIIKAKPDEYEIVGQVFDTYWMITLKDTLYVVDQHAAHEKIGYERLVKQFESNEEAPSQILCPTQVVHFTARDEDVFLKYMTVFQKIGYDIEAFGQGAYTIRAVPMNLYGVSSEELFHSLLNELSEKDSIRTPEVVLERLAMASCKAAVKGNHKMTYEEMKELMQELMSLKNPYNCPHGRPVFIAITKTDMEKKFKRIV